MGRGKDLYPLKQPAKLLFFRKVRANPHNTGWWLRYQRSPRKSMGCCDFQLRREPKSGCQATPVCQNQIRQCELHMKFGFLFSSALVPRLAITEQAFDNPEYMLDLCANR